MLVLTVALLVAGLVRKWDWALKAALVPGLVGILSGFLSEKIDRAWMALSNQLGKVIPPLMLGLIFYLFLFPLALLFRGLSRKDPLVLRNSGASLFRETRKQFDKTSFERTW